MRISSYRIFSSPQKFVYALFRIANIRPSISSSANIRPENFAKIRKHIFVRKSLSTNLRIAILRLRKSSSTKIFVCANIRIADLRSQIFVRTPSSSFRPIQLVPYPAVTLRPVHIVSSFPDSSVRLSCAVLSFQDTTRRE